ncbi:MAG: hypothetical protein O3A00_20470 [Planctomycetota bacterium]|nr:hypothetical protein [Planctomycetota bacterium]
MTDEFFGAGFVQGVAGVEWFVLMFSGIAGFLIEAEFGWGIGLVVGLGIIYGLRRGWILQAMADPSTVERRESVSVAASKNRRRLSREGKQQDPLC